MLPPKVRSVLRLCTDIVPKIPQRGDTLFGSAVKIISMLDSLAKVSETSKIDGFVEKMGLSARSSEQFVRVFYATTLRDHFKIKRHAITEYMQAVEASPLNGTKGKLFFIETTYYGGKSTPSETFYHTPETDFSRILQQLWAIYDQRIQMSLQTGDFGQLTPTFDGFPGAVDPLYGKANELLNRVCRRHQQYQKDKVARTYMLSGEPGTGKSTFAIRFAEQNNGRLFKLDATALESMDERGLVFLLQGLQPDFLLIDDIDKASVAKALPRLLSMVPRLKAEIPNIAILMTANDPKKLDPAFRRTGRIDLLLEFKLPDAEERRALLEGYLKTFGAKVTARELRRLVLRTVDCTNSDLREIALQLRYDPVSQVLETLAGMQRMTKEVVAPATALPVGVPVTKT